MNKQELLDFERFFELGDPEENLLLDVDSYKASHWLQYPPNTKRVFSYIESRGGKYDETVFFGLQIYLKKYLTKPIEQWMIDQAEIFFKYHGEPFNREGWEYIVKEHDGKLPVEIKAVKEGTLVPYKNILVSIMNTDDNVPWLTSYIETSLHRAVWYPVTVASNSYASKKVIKKYLEETVDDDVDLGALLDFMLHDFGARGVSSKESAGIGGAAHLVNFKGTDNITGAIYAMKYYKMKRMVAFSVPAAEHSSITTWLREGEIDSYRNMLVQFGGKYPIISVVSDSYDIYNAVGHIWGEVLKEEVIQCGSTLVIRPDSGDPAQVVLKVAQLIDQTFGSTLNRKGYKVFNHVKILQGDGITTESIEEILKVLKANKFSAMNIVFGQGGALLQQVDRDTNKFAMKACAALIDDEWIDVYKDPITDKGKGSKRGRLMLYYDVTNAKFVTDRDGKETERFLSLLNRVYANGEITWEVGFEEVRSVNDAWCNLI